MTEYDVYRKYPDYKYLGSVNWNEDAQKAYYKSEKHEQISIGRCLYMVVLHDLKAIVQVDSGD